MDPRGSSASAAPVKDATVTLGDRIQFGHTESVQQTGVVQAKRLSPYSGNAVDTVACAHVLFCGIIICSVHFAWQAIPKNWHV